MILQFCLKVTLKKNERIKTEKLGLRRLRQRVYYIHVFKASLGSRGRPPPQNSNGDKNNKKTDTDDLKSISVAGHLPTTHEALGSICSPRKSSKVKMWNVTANFLSRQRGCQTLVHSVEVTETFSGGPWISLLFTSVLATHTCNGGC